MYISIYEEERNNRILIFHKTFLEKIENIFIINERINENKANTKKIGYKINNNSMISNN